MARHSAPARQYDEQYDGLSRRSSPQFAAPEGLQSGTALQGSLSGGHDEGSVRMGRIAKAVVSRQRVAVVAG